MPKALFVAIAGLLLGALPAFAAPDADYRKAPELSASGAPIQRNAKFEFLLTTGTGGGVYDAVQAFERYQNNVIKGITPDIGFVPSTANLDKTTVLWDLDPVFMSAFGKANERERAEGVDKISAWIKAHPRSWETPSRLIKVKADGGLDITEQR